MQINKLHYITGSCSDAEYACRGGIDWIQLRVKNKPEEEWKALAREIKKVCRQYGAKLIINDHVYLAKEIGADGVHLGKEDMPHDKARSILGDQFIIGGTANTWEDIQRLVSLKVDYIGLGPYHDTRTKVNLSPLLGIEGIVSLMKKVGQAGIKTQIIAIGGIKRADIHSILNTGLQGIAVSSAISDSGNIEKESGLFVEKIKNHIRNGQEYAGNSR
jgi:thiamine-phosphate pyrophosphorylase